MREIKNKSTSVTYDQDEDVNNKLHKFQNICGTIRRNLKKKTRKGTELTFYKTIAVPVLMYGSEAWTIKKKDISRIQSAEIKFLRSVKGCTRMDRISNEIRTELEMYAIQDKITEYRIRWSAHLQRMDNSRLPKQALQYKPRGRDGQLMSEQETLLYPEVMMMMMMMKYKCAVIRRGMTFISSIIKACQMAQKLLVGTDIRIHMHNYYISLS
jgi:hypothetical protein